MNFQKPFIYRELKQFRRICAVILRCLKVRNVWTFDGLNVQKLRVVYRASTHPGKTGAEADYWSSELNLLLKDQSKERCQNNFPI